MSSGSRKLVSWRNFLPEVEFIPLPNGSGVFFLPNLSLFERISPQAAQLSIHFFQLKSVVLHTTICVRVWAREREQGRKREKDTEKRESESRSPTHDWPLASWRCGRCATSTAREWRIENSHNLSENPITMKRLNTEAWNIHSCRKFVGAKNSPSMDLVRNDNLDPNKGGSSKVLFSSVLAE